MNEQSYMLMVSEDFKLAQTPLISLMR
jgi:hypothetical protein